MSNTKYIAIVDDHTMFRKGLRALIDFFPGYKVLFDAANGKDFIKQLKPNHLPDILLLDISMPEMDGYATAEWVRVNHPSVNILALSTMDGETAIIKMIKCGAKGYILKDTEPADLKLAFSEILNNGFYYPDSISRKIIQSINNVMDEKSSITSFMSLNNNEVTFLKLACSEKSYQEIAKEMCLSEKTVDGYRDSLFKKLRVTTRVGMVMYAIKNGVISL